MNTGIVLIIILLVFAVIGFGTEYLWYRELKKQKKSN